MPLKVTPLKLFSPLADMPWSMWLDSCDSEHIDSRFDILVWSPKVTLTTFDKTTHIEWTNSQWKNKPNPTTSQEEPLQLIKQLTQQVFGSNPNRLNNDLPFSGGALGYFSYDLGRQFEHIPNKAEHDIKIPDMAIGIYDQAIIFDKHNHTCWLICDEGKREQTEIWLKKNLNTSQELSKANKDKKNNFYLTQKWQSNINKASYKEKFQQVQNHLLLGDCYQINLAQRFSAHYKGDEFQAYVALRKENKAPFSAFIRLEDSAILSISPERFLKVSSGKVQSKPIKGTMPRSKNKAQDEDNAQQLKHSTKDRAENVMIVDLLRNDLSKVCKPSSVVVPQLFEIESFPAVHHLVSTVEGTLLNNYHATDLLRAAFPGGSITGAPKIRAMEIIEELEPHRRSVYCGSIGYISNCGTMDTNITIRTLVCERKNKIDSKENSIYCWAGGGLVADSKVDCEYQETFDKVKLILPVLEELSGNTFKRNIND